MIKRSFKKLKASHAVLALLVLLVAALVAGRLYLPTWAAGYVNRQIAALEGYSGSIDDIDISLWRGAYQIHGLNIHKTAGGLKKPFVAARTVDLSVEWKALLHGSTVAEADIYDINFNFAKSQSGADGAGWGRLIDSLSPFDINRLAVHGGRVAYLDYSRSPDVNLYIASINGSITNLRNVEDKEAALPSELQVTGTSIGGGKVNLGGRVNILQDVPDFDVDLKLENAALNAFNDYTRAAIAVDFAKGSASIYSELAAADGHLTGYIKFLATDVEVIDMRQDNVFNALWESIAATFMNIFKNHPEDQFALRVPIEGRIDNPDRDGWAAFVSIFKNAFGRAFPRDTDGNINFADALEKSTKK